MIELIEIEPGRWRVKREVLIPPRSDLPMPHVISDTMPPTEQVDGKHYTSKSAFRAVGKANGLIEVGTEKFKPRVRKSTTREYIEKRRDTIRKAVQQVNSGVRTPRP